jgi:hypothetical protein
MVRETFPLADGSHRHYAVGEAFLEREGHRGTSKVVYCTPLLGALTLESLGWIVNPVTHELRPMRLRMAALTSPRRAASPARWPHAG